MATRRMSPYLALAAACLMLVVVGCAGTSEPADEGSTTTQNSTPDTTAETPGSTGETPDSTADLSGQVNIIAPTNAPSDAGFQAVTEAFNEAYPNVTATYTGVAEYDTTRAAQLAAGTADIVVCFPRQPQEFTGQTASEDTLMAQAGQFVDLTDEPFMDNYTQTVLESPRSAIDGRVYAAPTGLAYATGVFYNEQIFEDNDLEIPTTWAELLEVIDTLNAQGITPFGYGGLDAFPQTLPLYGLINSMYPDDDAKWDLLEGLWDGSVDLTTGTPLEILERLQVVYDNSTDISPGMTIVESLAAFGNGEFAMVFDGTWDQKAILDVVDSRFEFGMFPFPGGDQAEENQFLSGKIELQLCVAEASENKEAALAWLEFFSQPENYTSFVENSGFAPAQPNIVTEDAFMESIAPYTDEFRLFWEAIFIAPQGLAPEGNTGFAYSLLEPFGSSTPEEAATAAQAAWAAVR